MKTVIYRYIAFAILTIFSLGGYSFAENVDRQIQQIVVKKMVAVCQL